MMATQPVPHAQIPRGRTIGNARLWSIAYLAHLSGRRPEEIDLDANVAACALDSVDAVVMASAMEEHFGIEIDAGLFLKDAPIEGLLTALCNSAAWGET